MPWTKEHRCPNDDKLLFKGMIVEGGIEIKCKFCKEIIHIEPTPLNELVCKKKDCPNRIHQ